MPESLAWAPAPPGEPHDAITVDNGAAMTADLPRLYTDLADWFHLLTAPPDYAEVAELYRRLIDSESERPASTLLELGSGGGNNASHLKAHYQLTLTDLSAQMLDVSRRINPELEHIEGDMRTLRLGRTFDVVFAQDAISYMATEDDLRAAITTAAAHLRPGGVALFHPDHTRETFRPSTHHGGHDGADGRGLRYLDWVHDLDAGGSRYVSDHVYLLRHASGELESVVDRHVMGAHSRATWLRLLNEAGFDAEVRPFAHSEIEPGSSELFVARRR